MGKDGKKYVPLRAIGMGKYIEIDKDSAYQMLDDGSYLVTPSNKPRYKITPEGHVIELTDADSKDRYEV